MAQSKNVLRVIGMLCFGCTLMVGLAWQDASTLIKSVDKTFTLQSGQTITIPFTPALKDAVYIINLHFEDTQTSSLNCQDIHSLSIHLSILIRGKALALGNLLDNSKARDFSCRKAEGITTISFSVPEFKISKRYILQLALKHEANKISNFKSRILIYPFGIAVHYALIDLEILELFGGALLIIGLSCFLPDFISCFSFVFKHRT